MTSLSASSLSRKVFKKVRHQGGAACDASIGLLTLFIAAKDGMPFSSRKGHFNFRCHRFKTIPNAYLGKWHSDLLNRSSRRESALTLLWIKWSGLMSAATRFMGRTNVNTNSAENVEDPNKRAHFWNYRVVRSVSACGPQCIGTALPRGISNRAHVNWNGHHAPLFWMPEDCFRCFLSPPQSFLPSLP